jgi:hypothetical protein
VMNSIIRKQTTEAFKGIELDAHEASKHVREEFERMREAGEKTGAQGHLSGLDLGRARLAFRLVAPR